MQAMERRLTSEDLATSDGVGVAGDTAEDGNGRAASSDGDVQGADVNTEQAGEDAYKVAASTTGVLDILAALRSAGGLGRGPGRGGKGTGGKSESDKGLGELHVWFGCLRTWVKRGVVSGGLRDVASKSYAFIPF
jgi:hypothetical protein